MDTRKLDESKQHFIKLLIDILSDESKINEAVKAIGLIRGKSDNSKNVYNEDDELQKFYAQEKEFNYDIQQIQREIDNKKLTLEIFEQVREGAKKSNLFTISIKPLITDKCNLVINDVALKIILNSVIEHAYNSIISSKDYTDSNESYQIIKWFINEFNSECNIKSANEFLEILKTRFHSIRTTHIHSSTVTAIKTLGGEMTNPNVLDYEPTDRKSNTLVTKFEVAVNQAEHPSVSKEQSNIAKNTIFKPVKRQEDLDSNELLDQVFFRTFYSTIINLCKDTKYESILSNIKKTPLSPNDIVNNYKGDLNIDNLAIIKITVDAAMEASKSYIENMYEDPNKKERKWLEGYLDDIPNLFIPKLIKVLNSNDNKMIVNPSTRDIHPGIEKILKEKFVFDIDASLEHNEQNPPNRNQI